MKWPFVSVARFEDVKEDVAKLREENRQLHELVVKLTGEKAVAEAKAQSLQQNQQQETDEPDSDEPVRGKVRIDQVRTKANEWAAAGKPTRQRKART